jgi:hypothetical protein
MLERRSAGKLHQEIEYSLTVEENGPVVKRLDALFFDLTT